jgi:hypothetical protein
VNAAETLAALAALMAADRELDVATVARPASGNGQHEARYLSLADDARDFFHKITSAAVPADVEEAELRRLDHTYKPEAGEIEWVPLAEVEAVKTACERYANMSPLGPFDPNDEQYKRRLAFWVGVVAHGQERAFFFRAFSAAAELKRKAGAALVSRQGSFRRVEEQIFLFDESVDCFVFGEYLYVLRKSDYRRVFDQLEEVRRQARKAAEQLHQLVPIANFEEFADACTSQTAMADKLIAVQKRNYFGRLTYQMLAPVIKEFELEIPTQIHNGTTHLVFKSAPAHRWRILRLVDDDYLRSTMTDNRYEVNSKTEK